MIMLINHFSTRVEIMPPAPHQAPVTFFVILHELHLAKVTIFFQNNKSQ